MNPDWICDFSVQNGADHCGVAPPRKKRGDYVHDARKVCNFVPNEVATACIDLGYVRVSAGQKKGDVKKAITAFWRENDFTPDDIARWMRRQTIGQYKTVEELLV